MPSAFEGRAAEMPIQFPLAEVRESRGHPHDVGQNWQRLTESGDQADLLEE